MKKTLERLKKDAFGDVDLCLSAFEESWKEMDEMSKEERDLLDLFSEYIPRAVLSLLRYVQALEDYGYELDEEWDKLLKRIEQAQAVKKEGKNKPSYRV